MIIFKRVADLREHLQPFAASGSKTGFVPTMGALHEGHLSLIRHSREAAAYTVCSIFVNPTQFNDPSDYEKYPVTIDHDILLLEHAGCDVLFLPSVHEMYPEGTGLSHPFDLGRLDSLLESAHRPGHFQGVCQVMYRLLDIVKPDLLFMGRKDYQQCMVVQRLIDINHWAIRLEIVPIMREESGLAMSSRNRRLSESAKEKATAIYHTLLHLQSSLAPGPVDRLLSDASKHLLDAGFEKIDYVSLADAGSLEAVNDWDGRQKLVALVAAFIEGVRLIDNMAMTEAG